MVAVIAAPQLFAGLGLWRAYVLEPVLVFVVLHAVLTEEGQRRRLQRSFLLIVFPLVAWAVVQFMTGQGIPHPWDVSIAAGRRATGPYPFPNALALFVTPIAAYAFAAWVRYPRRLLSLATFIVSVVGILLVRSDGGLVGLLAAMTLTLLGIRWGRWLVAIGIASVITILGLVPSIRTALWQELTFQGWSGRVRVWMWTETWQMLKDHWFFGAGFGGYPTVFDPYHKKRFIEIFQYPHTLVFNFWSETGLLGLATFTGIIVTWIRERLQAWRKQRYTDAMIFLAPLVAILVHGLVDVPYFKNDLALQFWIFAFLAQTTFHNKVVDVNKEAC
jgi:O-antigen ligase